MRIANIIIAHKEPSQLERLILKMSHPQFDFYIHVDKKVDITQFLYLVKYANVKFIKNRQYCNWGGYSTLLAMTGSLTEVLRNDIDYGFYNLLSGQDYPIKSNIEIYNFFKENSEKSYIFYETVNEEIWWKGAVNRYEKYHFTDYNFKGKSILEQIINRLLPKRRFPLQVKLYGGDKASWWSLNHICAEYISNYFEYKIKFSNFLKMCWGTDEFVIPTLLVNSEHKEKIVNDNLRYIHFPEGSANPKILIMTDLDGLMNSNSLFARKFDHVLSNQLMDEIDMVTK